MSWPRWLRRRLWPSSQEPSSYGRGLTSSVSARWSTSSCWVLGTIALGFSAFDGASELYDFAFAALNARSDTDFEQAGRHFARAVVVLGVSTIQAILLRGQGRTIVARGRPTIQPRIRLADPPPPGQPTITRTSSLPADVSGETDAYGIIKISTNQSISEQRVALYHELVHRFFAPRMGPLRKLRAELNMSSYERSALLRYMEEAMAEGYGQLRVNGLAPALRALRFPLQEGYVVVSEIVAEGMAIGTVSLGGVLFRVSIAPGPMPEEP